MVMFMLTLMTLLWELCLILKTTCCQLELSSSFGQYCVLWGKHFGKNNEKNDVKTDGQSVEQEQNDWSDWHSMESWSGSDWLAEASLESSVQTTVNKEVETLTVESYTWLWMLLLINPNVDDKCPFGTQRKTVFNFFLDSCSLHSCFIC